MSLSTAAASKQPQRAATANDALQMIAAIYHAEGKLKDLTPRERLRKRKRAMRLSLATRQRRV